MMDQTVEERVSQALLWLGFQDVEIGKHFSAKKFENNEESIENEITYSSKDNLIPKAITPQLIKFMEYIINYNKIQKESKNDSK